MKETWRGGGERGSHRGEDEKGRKTERERAGREGHKAASG